MIDLKEAQEHQYRIQNAAFALNDAIISATNDGIRVDIDETRRPGTKSEPGCDLVEVHCSIEPCKIVSDERKSE